MRTPEDHNGISCPWLQDSNSVAMKNTKDLVQK